MNFNTQNFTPFKRSNVAPNEMANYDSYKKPSEHKNLDDVIVIFDSAASLIEHFFHNVKEAGGNGTWKTADSGIGKKSDFNSTDSWKFGKHFLTFQKTVDALNSGSIPVQYLNRLEQRKHELYSKYPELYEISDMAVTKRRKRKFSEDGDELDIDRYMCADPSMWSSMPRQDSRKRCATFFIDFAVSAGTDFQEIINGVIDSVALIDIVQKAGIPTEVICGGVTRRGTKGTNMLTVACKAKHADEVLDINRLLSFCLTGFYRSLTFCTWVNVSEGQEGEWGLGNGNWSFDSEKEYFDFFNALIKTRPKDYYWNEQQMELNIKNIRKFIES